MLFGSFLPNRKGNRRRPPSAPPATDPDATAVNPAWQSILQTHLADQQTPPVGPGPLPTHGPVGSRHEPSSPSVPQRSLQNAEPTQFLPRIPKFNNVEEYNAFMRQHGTPPEPPKPYQVVPKPKPVDPTDMTFANVPLPQDQPIELSRVCRYRGDGGGILVVVGYQVISANHAGVTIVPNNYGQGPTLRAVIPWHRIWELLYTPGDPIGNFK